VTGAQWGLWLLLSTLAIGILPPAVGWLIGFSVSLPERVWVRRTLTTLRGLARGSQP
jgi:hypothetical protein